MFKIKFTESAVKQDRFTSFNWAEGGIAITKNKTLEKEELDPSDSQKK